MGAIMKAIRRAVYTLSCLPVLALAGCGDGWEMVQVRGQVPYTEERTAGPGIAYVRAHLMPEKTLVLPEPVAAPVKDAAPIFDKKVQKK